MTQLRDTTSRRVDLEPVPGNQPASRSAHLTRDWSVSRPTFRGDRDERSRPSPRRSVRLRSCSPASGASCSRP